MRRKTRQTCILVVVILVALVSSVCFIWAVFATPSAGDDSVKMTSNSRPLKNLINPSQSHEDLNLDLDEEIIKAEILEQNVDSQVNNQAVDIDEELLPWINSLKMSASQLPKIPGLADRTRTFVLHPFFARADQYEEISSRKVCLATQTSVDRLFWLANTTESWSSHVSVVVLGPGKELQVTQLAIDILRYCFPDTIANWVTFSLASDLRHPPEPINPQDLETLLGDTDFTLNLCTDIRHTLRTLTRRLVGSHDTAWRTELKYPQNLLRNWAKALCNSDWTLVVDVDMVPSRGMAERVDAFFEDPDNGFALCTKCVFIVPTYEISEDMRRFPQDKTELVSWVNNGKARVFHIGFWPPSCRSSRLQEWEKIPYDASYLSAAYEVKKIEAKYEPIFIGAADIPGYDERLIGYGHDRYLQFYELYLANYTFHVLDNVFTSHWEFQVEKSRPLWRKKQRYESLGNALEIVTELRSKYGRDPLAMVALLNRNIAHYSKYYEARKKT